MTLDYKELRGSPSMDVRMIREIQERPSMYREQIGSGFMEGWGGLASRKVLSKLSTKDRLVYAAVMEGNTGVEQIATVTDLSIKDAEAAVKRLQKKGMVDISVPSGGEAASFGDRSFRGSPWSGKVGGEEVQVDRDRWWERGDRGEGKREEKGTGQFGSGSLQREIPMGRDYLRPFRRDSSRQEPEPVGPIPGPWAPQPVGPLVRPRF